MIVSVGLSHKTAPLAVRERLAIGPNELPEMLRRIAGLDGVGEAVVVSTCNRVEVYAAPPAGAVPPGLRRGGGREAPDPWEVGLDLAVHAVTAALASMGGDHVAAHLAAQRGRGALVHLFRVAASLDSLVVGEPQILGQLKDAIDAARDAKTLGPTLGKAMHHAVRVGKRVRTETAIGAGQVSVSSVAADLARDIFGELGGRVVMLVGAGEMAEAAAKHLARSGARLVVVNRSPERARALAQEVSGEPRSFAELERSLVEADIVISSTASQGHVLRYDFVKGVRKARRGRSLFLIDIAVPRDIDPRVNELESVYLYDIDDLSQIVAESLEGRAAEAARAEAIVQDETRGFEVWTLERSMAPTIAGLRARTKGVLLAEVDRSLSGKLKHLGAAEREALAVMVEAATNKLLHAPTTRLRTLAHDPRATDYLEALHDLFDLPPPCAPAAPPGPPPEGDEERPAAAANGLGHATEAAERAVEPEAHARAQAASAPAAARPEGT